ncbi:uncharacterized protein LOC121388550 [Gigantopelta aegis]|uniref:uncharacterized protein LOC121388550 n=1 Tax=Gigantopelta aegis TaxID=1735272 RepID=UPI001B8876CC|nr:uncharacterized protein LOC121388550 [Gigantopelta aegis]
MAWSGSDENQLALTKGIQSFLRSVGMDQYYNTFIAKGFDLESDLQFLTTADLDELDIRVPEHRCVLLASAPLHRVSEGFRVYQWLRDSGLDYYFVSFIRSELVDFNELRNLELPDDDLYDELEITLTGHKKRLERAVQKLRKRQRTTEDAEPAIIEGWWGKPLTLTEAKYDFLCVSATIGSTRRHSQCQTIDFMVDSGSDVTTLREEILQTLDLQLLGPIQSRGVHASCTKNLYKARLQIGTEVLEIEVMGESYDSLGSRVFRHFRHYITGSKHVWLKGDYYDPSMTPQPTIPHQVATEIPSDANDPETADTDEEKSDEYTTEVLNESTDTLPKSVLSDVCNTESEDDSMSSQKLMLSDSRLEDGLDTDDIADEQDNTTSCSAAEVKNNCRTSGPLAEVRVDDMTSCSVVETERNNMRSCCVEKVERNNMMSCSVEVKTKDMTSCSIEDENNDMMSCSVEDENNAMTSCCVEVKNNDMTSCSVEVENNDMTSSSVEVENNDMTSCSVEVKNNDMTSCSVESCSTCLVLDQTVSKINHNISKTDSVCSLELIQTLQKYNAKRKRPETPQRMLNCGRKRFPELLNENSATSSPCLETSANVIKPDVPSSSRSGCSENKLTLPENVTGSSSLLPHRGRSENTKNVSGSSSLLPHRGRSENESRSSLPLYVLDRCESSQTLCSEDCEILDESEGSHISKPCDSDSDTNDSQISDIT